MKLFLVVGTRPNFMKLAPLWRELRKYRDFDPYVVHTGQHYDANMSDLFFRQLGVPQPQLNLGVGSGSHTVQTAGRSQSHAHGFDQRSAVLLGAERSR